MQIEEKKKQEAKRKQEVDEKLAQFDIMQTQMNLMQKKIEEDQPKIHAVMKLFEDGQIAMNESGDFVALPDEESQR